MLPAQVQSVSIVHDESVQLACGVHTLLMQVSVGRSHLPFAWQADPVPPMPAVQTASHRYAVGQSVSLTHWAAQMPSDEQTSFVVVQSPWATHVAPVAPAGAAVHTPLVQSSPDVERQSASMLHGSPGLPMAEPHRFEVGSHLSPEGHCESEVQPWQVLVAESHISPTMLQSELVVHASRQ